MAMLIIREVDMPKTSLKLLDREPRAPVPRLLSFRVVSRALVLFLSLFLSHLYNLHLFFDLPSVFCTSNEVR